MTHREDRTTLVFISYSIVRNNSEQLRTVYTCSGLTKVQYYLYPELKSVSWKFDLLVERLKNEWWQTHATGELFNTCNKSDFNLIVHCLTFPPTNTNALPAVATNPEL